MTPSYQCTPLIETGARGPDAAVEAMTGGIHGFCATSI